MPKKKAAAAVDTVDELGEIAAKYGVPRATVQIAADLWCRHYRYQHVDSDAQLAYVAACGRMVTADGAHVALDVVEAVKDHVRAEVEAGE